MSETIIETAPKTDIRNPDIERIIKAEKAFTKKAKKRLKSNPNLRKIYLNVIDKTFMNRPPFAPSLKTHKLSGHLKDTYSCTVTEDIRITFGISDDTIHMLNIGTHDEVY
ncbi:MAG: type II toxin-antitoxin system mRNA interferase toxin, RelE/StbE family [Nitrospirae bacterium]|nr:type II toxin-antitoxin system mRNA interferase toxin, RelE/StbE family [Nitrospirota bacterium]